MSFSFNKMEFVPASSIVEQQYIDDINKRNIDDEHMKFVTYSSADAKVSEQDIFTYYCCICGSLALVSNADIAKCSTRQLEMTKLILGGEYTSYLISGPKVYMDRNETTIEVQIRQCCPDCGQHIAYLGTKLKDKGEPLFVYQDALITNQVDALVLKPAK